MNIQDTIKELGLEDKSLPRILKQRVNTAQSLVEKVKVAENEYNESPNEEAKENLEDVKSYTKEYFDDAVELLKTYKTKLDAKAKKEEEAKKENEQKIEETEVKAESVKAEENKEVASAEEKSSGGGWGAILIGGVVLVATLGAVNILKNK